MNACIWMQDWAHRVTYVLCILVNVLCYLPTCYLASSVVVLICWLLKEKKENDTIAIPSTLHPIACKLFNDGWLKANSNPSWKLSSLIHQVKYALLNVIIPACLALIFLFLPANQPCVALAGWLQLYGNNCQIFSNLKSSQEDFLGNGLGEKTFMKHEKLLQIAGKRDLSTSLFF